MDGQHRPHPGDAGIRRDGLAAPDETGGKSARPRTPRAGPRRAAAGSPTPCSAPAPAKSSAACTSTRRAATATAAPARVNMMRPSVPAAVTAPRAALFAAHALSRSAFVRSPPPAKVNAASMAARGRGSSGWSASRIATTVCAHPAAYLAKFLLAQSNLACLTCHDSYPRLSRLSRLSRLASGRGDRRARRSPRVLRRQLGVQAPSL